MAQIPAWQFCSECLALDGAFRLVCLRPHVLTHPARHRCGSTCGGCIVRSTAVAADPEREPLTGGPPPASIQPIHPFTPQAERSRSSISRTIVLRRESQL